MPKAIAEQSNSLNIFWLKKQGYFLKGGSMRGGTVTWSYGMSDSKSSIGIWVVVGMKDEPNYIKLNYTHTDHWTGEKSEMDYRIGLATTPCNYGGMRYWFICPLTKGGRHCGRRVGVIYSIGKWFGCRHCGEIAYNSQMSGGRFRGSSVCIPDIEKAELEVKRYYYGGKPTRKYRRVLKMDEKLNMSFILMAARFDKRFKDYL
ncbi:MAG: hypothetical protein ABIH36_00905 [bacterium]